MKIILSVGHSILKSGACTSADGRPYGGILEYAYNKNIVHRIAEYLREAGHQVDVLICPEQQFSTSTEERIYKIPRVNAGGYDLVAELHLNASKYHNGRGSEVFYICDEGEKIAKRIQERFATVFQNRGVKSSNSLYMLNSTKPVALIIESFFCDNSADCALAEKTDVARLIAEGIHGGPIAEGEEVAGGGIEETPTGIFHRVQVGAFQVKANAQAMEYKLKEMGFEAFITTVDIGDRILYRVQVGAFQVKANAQAMKDKLEVLGFEAFIAVA